ncbi:MAG TPA: cysteine synthase family protein [Bacteroidota bacterium]|nr:cysteine synthase family protein [Bacteroidota bacterium]
MVTFAEKKGVLGAALDQLIGNTPLLSLSGIARSALSPAVEMYAKAEWYNPGGSVKDRAAWFMVQEGLRSGALTGNRILIDATSGNTGIAYAMIGAALGFQVQLALPANASAERKRMLAALGAEMIFTDPLAGTDGAREVVQKLVREQPDRYFYPDQYNNPANWRAHYRTTAQEIIGQTSGRVTHFVAGLGTCGTFVGVARRLKEFNPAITCIAVQPDAPFHGIEGLKHLASAAVPAIFDATLVDETVSVSTEEAYAMARRLAREAGLLVGTSSAAALVATLSVASRLAHGVLVTIFPDHGSRYLSERFWESSYAETQPHRVA